MVKYIFTKEEIEKWLNCRERNPRTDRKIKEGASIWKQLVKQSNKFTIDVVEKTAKNVEKMNSVRTPGQELIENYLLFLDVEDIYRMRLVNKDYKNIIDGLIMWNQLLKRDFKIQDNNPREKYFFEYFYRKVKNKEVVNLPLDFLTRNVKNLSWGKVLKYVNLTEENFNVIKKFQYKKKDWIYKNPTLKMYMVNKYNKIIYKYQRLDDKFLKTYHCMISWFNFSQNKYLTYDIIKKYKKRINWNYIWEKVILSEKLISTYEKKVKWDNLSMNKSLTQELVEKYQDKINLSVLQPEVKLDRDFILKSFNKFSDNYLIQNLELNDFILNKLQIKGVTFKEISTKKDLDINFMQKYEKSLDWDIIAEYHILNDEFLKKFLKNLKFEALIRNKDIRPELIDKKMTYLDLRFLLNCIDTISLSNLDKYKSTFFKRDCERWLQNRKSNPKTGRKIKEGSSVYKKLLEYSKHYKLI